MTIFAKDDAAQTTALTEEIRKLRLSIAELKGEREARDTELRLVDSVRTLKEKIEALKIEKSTLEEANARKERELRHEIGLEKKRQEFELEAGKRDAVLSVREENLTADRKRFEEQMTFTQTRFEAEVGYLKTLMGEILDRLPTVTVDRTIEQNGHSARKAEVAARR